MRKINCLRCNTPLKYLKSEQIQLGRTGWILGDLPNLFAGALEVAIYVCPNCGKIEFYQQQEEDLGEIAQRKCPHCGKMHDIDYPKCPFCKYDYYVK